MLPTRAWTPTLGWAFVLTIVFFLVAQLGLALLARPSDVSAFCPTTGIAAGIMIVFGRRAWPALVMGLVAGAVATSLISEKDLLTSLLRSICSAGEAVIVAWLLERWVGRPFAFSGLPRVAGFLAVAGLVAAAFAAVGAATTTLLNPAALFWDTWRVWFLSNGIGMVFVAPLIIELARAWREPPSRREMTEGVAVLVLLALVAIHVHTHPTSSWISFDQDAFTLPLLLWLAVRCPPPFAITGSFVVSILAIGTTALGIGHLSDAGLPIVERVHGVQTTVMVTTAYTLVLVALFTERRLRAALLERSNERLHNQEVAFRRLLGALPAAIHTTDTAGRITYYNKAAAEMWGASPKLNEDKCSDLGRLYYEDGTLVPPDECPTRACLMAGRAIEGREALFERPDGKRIPIIPYPAPLTDDKGVVVGVVSMKLDISERKRAEAALAERNAQLDLAHVAAHVGSFTYDTIAGTVRFSGASAPIFGGSARNDMEITAEQWWARVHPDDIKRLRAENVCAFKERRSELVSEFRFVLPGGEIRWVEARSVVAYGDAGRAERITGVYFDVTERRKTEDHKNLLIAELDHRVKNVLACVAAIAQRSRECSRSSDEFLEVLNGRINSLANAHSLLSRSRWEGVELGELVRNELAPCMTDGSNLIGGPDIVLAAEATQPLSMVLHELATNASKYGALSSRRGRVSVSWERQSSAHDRLALEWRETGGPTIVAPGPSGYGSFVIRDLIPYELGGSVDYVLAPEGVRCRVEIPAKWLSDGLR
ncbi:MAG: MASE1 domain-containing protein [Hyphomicrobiaceae bacterium]